MSMVGSNYAAALYSLAKDEGLDVPVLEEMTVLGDAFARELDFLRLLSTPNLSKDERCAIIDNSFRGKVHPYVLNFMKILTQKGYARYFGDCCKAYRELYNADHGIISVLAVTAVALTEEQTEKLSRKLESVTGKTVELRNRIEPACLGGVRLDYDGRRLDGTVQNRLESIRNQLKNTVL